MNTQQTRKIGILFVAIGLVGALTSPAIAAQPVFDAENSNTSTTSEIVDGYTVNDFTANSSNESYIEVEFDSTNPLIKFINPDTDREITRIGPSSLNQTYSNSSNSVYHYATNVSHDQFVNVEMNAGENQSIKVVTINNSSAQTQDMTNATIYLNNSDDRTVRRVTGGDTLTIDSGYEVPAVNYTIGDRSASYSEDSIPVDANGTLRLAAANSTTVDLLDSNAEDADSGAALWSAPTYVNGNPVVVYAEEKPDGHPDGFSYGVYNASNDAVVLHFSDDVDSDTVDISMTANAGVLSQIAATTNWTIDTMSVPPVLQLTMSLLSIGFGLALTTRREQDSGPTPAEASESNQGGNGGVLYGL